MNDVSRRRAATAASLLLPPLLVMGLIFFLSAQPDEGADRTAFEVLLRKVAHVTEYAVLTLLWWRALFGHDRGSRVAHALAGAALISLLYAASDEYHQTLVSGRNGTPVDVLIDSLGIALASAAVLLYARRRRRTVGPSRPSAA